MQILIDCDVALTYAAKLGFDDIVTILLRHGANINFSKTTLPDKKR